MELKEYIKQSDRTMIDKGFSMNMLHASLGIVTETAELLDAYKKHIFYGKELDLVNIKEEIGDIFWYLAIPLRYLSEEEQDILINQFERDRFFQRYTIQTLILDVKKACFEVSVLLDNRNDKELVIPKRAIIYFIIELWNLLGNLGFYLDDILQINIDKLAKRYPEKFDSNLALNRDLKAEREVLEGLNTKTEQEPYRELSNQEVIDKLMKQYNNERSNQWKEVIIPVSPSDYKQMQELGMIPKEKDNIENVDLKTIDGEGKGLFEGLFLTDGINNYPVEVDNSGIDNRVPKVGE